MRRMAEELTRVGVDAARLAGEMLQRHFRDRTLEVEAKAAHDFVTEADRESESLIVDAIRSRYPDHSIETEEAGFIGPRDAECRWIIDPLDGTSNFLKGLPIWSISIACRRQDRTVSAVVFDPLRNDLFAATEGCGARLNGDLLQVADRDSLEDAFLATGFPFRARGALSIYLQIFEHVFKQARGIRRCGSAALDLAYTAAGMFDGFFEFRLSAWDIAAGELLIREAGGVLTDIDGGVGHLRSGNVVAGSAAVHAALLAAVRLYASESRLDELAPVEERAEIG